MLEADWSVWTLVADGRGDSGRFGVSKLSWYGANCWQAGGCRGFMSRGGVFWLFLLLFLICSPAGVGGLLADDGFRASI